MILLYISLAIVLIVISIFLYIRLKFGFWAIQPVFHIYDVQWWIFPRGIIRQRLPEKNRYCNFAMIDTITTDKLTDYQITKFIHLIQTNYLQNKENVFVPKKQNIIPYFSGHNSPSFFSFYKEDVILQDIKDGSTISDSAIISVMTSRPLHVTINLKNGTLDDTTFDVYYVDYLCVDKMYRKKGIAPQMIQTHEYNQRHLNKDIRVSLFKREDELTGIIPLTVYSTYGFDMNNWKKPIDLPPYYSLISINSHNIHFLLDFMKDNMNKFDIYISPDISNIIELIKTKNIYIYVIIQSDAIIAAYFLRKSCTMIKKRVEALSCFASINTTEEEVFIHGYKMAIFKICANTRFKFAIVEGISHNKIIIDNLVLRTKQTIISPTAYFFYNFAYSTFPSKRVFVLS